MAAQTSELPSWRCCLPTADETTLSLSCPLDQGAPWLAGRALDVLRQVTSAQSDESRERYVVGMRRDAPLILGEPLLWNGLPILAEASEPPGARAGEVTLRLPPWVELAERIPEPQFWELADHLAEELRSRCGVVSDGRAVGFPDLDLGPGVARRLQSLHLGVIIPPPWLDRLRPGSTAYVELPRSGLILVLE